MEELTVRNGLVVTPSGVIQGGLSASRGRITVVGVDSSLPKAKEEVDAMHKVILPGAIDPHLHLGYPTRPGKGEELFVTDMESETKAAASSGVTTVISTALFWGAGGKSNMTCIKHAKEVGNELASVDFKITAYILNPQHVAEVPKLFEEGVTSFKFLSAYRGEAARQVGVQDVTLGLIYKGFEAISKCPRPAMAMLHAENADLLDVFYEKFQSSGDHLAAWTATRPALCEAIDILVSGTIAKSLGLTLYYPHVGSIEAMNAIKMLRGEGADVIMETCPHYMTFTTDSPLGGLGKVNPPLRTPEDLEALWKAVAADFVDTVGTDHCVTSSHTQNREDLWNSTPGFASLGMPLPILINRGTHEGILTWPQIAKITSENVARAFGIYPRKGILAPGSDADFVIVDPEAQWTVDHKDWLKASEFCIYDGLELKGKVMKTFVRGRLVGENMAPVGQKGYGEFVAPVL